MTQLKTVFEELQGISKQVVTLFEDEAWETLDEILDVVHIFGKNINSNGICTEEDVKEMRDIKSDNPVLFSNILFDNLQLLIAEYQQLLTYEKQYEIIVPFRYEEYHMALIKEGNGNPKFINETYTKFESLINKLSPEVEAIIFIGYGSGYYQTQLLSTYQILTIDPFELPSKLHSDVVMSFTDKSFEQSLQYKLRSFVGLNTEVIVHPEYVYSDRSVEVLRVVRNKLQEVRIDLNTRVLFTEKWYHESFLNALHLLNNSNRVVNIDNLKNRHKGEKALMIAGGPSLEEALPYLKEAQHAYYIVAIGQTVKVLMDHEIIPDYVVSIDTEVTNSYFFKDLDLEIPLIYPMQLNHQIPMGTKGILIPYSDSSLSHELLAYSKSRFTTTPTVALSAVSFMYFAGFDKIGLIGQDLALREGEYYSSSVKKASSNDGQLSSTLYEVSLNNGEVGKTTPVLASFLNGYKTFLSIFSDLSLKMINYARLGAVIENVPYQPLETLDSIVIKKQKLKIDDFAEIIDIPLDRVSALLGSILNRLDVMLNRLKRVLQQKAVTIDEFEKMLRDWDAMIEAPSFRTQIMPLQLVNLLIIQNKIQFHNRYQRTSAMRLTILSQMQQTLQDLQKQIERLEISNLETSDLD